MRIHPKSVALVAVITVFHYSSALSQWALDTVVSTGANSTGIAITSDGSKLVVTNNTSPGSVKVISTSDYAVSNIDVSGVEDFPNGVAISPDNSTALVTTTHKVIFIDIASHSIKGSFSAPCVGTTLYGIAITPNDINAIFPDLSSGCTQQGLRTIDATGSTTGSSFVQVSSSGVLYGMAITPDGNSAIVTTFTSDSPKRISLASAQIQNITGMTGSYGVAIFHSGNEALIFDGDSLDRVSLTSNAVTRKISALSYNTAFQNIAITADDKLAFVVGAFEKLIISLANDSILQTFSAGGANVATTPDGSRFFVTDSYNGTVRVYKNQTMGVDKEAYSQVPSTFALGQNYPNPFNPATNIRYQVSKTGFANLMVYDILGKEVAILVHDVKQPGTYTVRFDGSRLASGLYFYRLHAGSYVETRKMLLLK